jgi:maleate cis-trans isomerase
MRLGLLYPGHAAEDDLPWLVDALFPDRSVHADVVHTSVGEDAHRVDALLDLGSADRLRAGAVALARNGADVAVWACTSGSFVFGWEGARRQVAELERDFGGPASSTSLAFVEAVRTLHLRRVAVAATYPEPVTRCFVELLSDAGLEVLASGSRDIVTAEEVGTVDRDTVLGLVVAGDHPDAEAVLVPDTALHTVRWLDELESAVSKPVLTANQVTVWEGLRLGGRPLRAAGHGSLFRAGLLG